METEEFNQPVNYPLCLICSLSVTTADIKIELPGLDQDNDDGNLSLIIFVLVAILEIPQNEVIKRQEKLTNKQLCSFCYCESCTKLIYSAKQIYTEILDLTRKFRNIQKEIVEQITVSEDLTYCTTTTTLSSSIHDYILKFCRNFQNKNVFNGFGYPFVVNEIPVKKSSLLSPQEVDKVKEEPVSVSENEAEDDDCRIGENDEDDYFQDSTTASSADEEDDQNKSDIDFEPEPPRKLIKKEYPTKSIRSVVVEADEDQDDHKAEEDYLQDSTSSADEDDSVSQTESDSDSEPPPPPKRVVKKITSKKYPSSSSSQLQQKGNRKSPSISKPKKPEVIRKKKTSRFDRLYPNYPFKRLRSPATKLFHCSEHPCSKSYNRKTRLETHIMIEHLQDNYYKCEEPSCGKSYANPEHYQDHVSWHAGIPRWKCEEKVKVTGTTMTSDGDSGTSEQCPKAFFCRRVLNRHVQAVHHSDKPFICEFCGAKFNCQDNLTCHKYIKHKDKGKKAGKKSSWTPEPQICDHCGKSYSGKNALQVHINLVHDNSVGKFGCKFCDHKFLISTHLKMHMYRKHNYSLDGFQMKRGRDTRFFRFQCNVYRCKRHFSKKETYKKHMEEKHGEGMEGIFEFNCKFCGMGFHLRNKFESHEEAHKNRESKPFSCDICGKRFATLPYLKIHRKHIHKIPMENARKPMK